MDGTAAQLDADAEVFAAELEPQLDAAGLLHAGGELRVDEVGDRGDGALGKILFQGHGRRFARAVHGGPRDGELAA
ncbi:MAG: hypothetical protein WDM96_05180 [Lacunisphaera sp.]